MPEWNQKAKAGAFGVGHTEAMTEQEAEALVVRLTRIWSKDVPAQGELELTDDDIYWDWSWTADLGEGVEVHIVNVIMEEQLEIDLFNYPPGLFRMSGHLRCEGDTLEVGRGDDKLERPTEFAQFASDWLPFFRRGCWLSGCPLEASAHDKAEWIQSFTSEEIEAWNLKM